MNKQISLIINIKFITFSNKKDEIKYSIMLKTIRIKQV